MHFFSTLSSLLLTSYHQLCVNHLFLLFFSPTVFIFHFQAPVFLLLSASLSQLFFPSFLSKVPTTTTTVSYHNYYR